MVCRPVWGFERWVCSKFEKAEVIVTKRVSGTLTWLASTVCCVLIAKSGFTTFSNRYRKSFRWFVRISALVSFLICVFEFFFGSSEDFDLVRQASWGELGTKVSVVGYCKFQKFSYLDSILWLPHHLIWCTCRYSIKPPCSCM